MALIRPIRVEGLRELNRSLRRIDSDLPKGLRLAGNKAAQIIVDDAKPRVPSRSGRAKGTIKAASTRTAVRVQAGGRKAPYFPWLDFGGRVGRNRSVHRPFIKQGRYVWRAYDDHKDRVREVYERELLAIVRSSGLDVT